MSVHSSPESPGTARLRYGGLVLAFLAVTGAGYLAFRAFAATPDKGLFNLYALAVVAGVASFFSPCAFPLLPTYFAVYYQAGSKGGASPGRGRALQLGVPATGGVLTFTLILGLAIALLGTGIAEGLSISGPAPNQFVRGFRGLVGAALLTLGIGQLGGWNLKPAFVDSFAFRTRPLRDGGRGPLTSLYLYGLGYTAAGMGCTGPILAGLIIFALSSGGFVPALTAFAVFSLTMGILMIVISVLVAASNQTLTTRLKAATPKIKTGASILLILVGLFNLYTAVNASLFIDVFLS